MSGSLRNDGGILSLLMCIVFSSPARGGPADSTAPGLCSLTLRTGSDTAWVFIDSFRAGRTPLTVDSLRGGAVANLASDHSKSSRSQLESTASRQS